jgi:hypothetical protein
MPCLLPTFRPDYFLPWQNHPKRESTGTGFVIRNRLILTNAHVVADQTYVTVKRHGSGTKFTAGGGQGGCAVHCLGVTWLPHTTIEKTYFMAACERLDTWHVTLYVLHIV